MKVQNPVVGGVAQSVAGRVVGIEGEKLLLADGKYREAANPKTKNSKHVRLLPVFHAEIAERLGLGKDENSEIRAALKAAAEERK